MDFTEHDFPALRDQIFMNHAGVAPLPARTADAMRAWLDQAVRTVATDWGGWALSLRQARNNAAALLGCTRHEIAFSHGTTHGLLVVAQSLDWRPGDNILLPEGEFPANIYPWTNLAARGVAVRMVPVGPDGRFRVDDFAARMDARTRLVAVSLVHYASGFRAPVGSLAGLCRARGALLCIDGIQGLGAMPVDVGSLGCDFLSAGGHKWLLSPEGFGVLYVRPDAMNHLNTQLCGWTGRPAPADYSNGAQPPAPTAKRFEDGSHTMVCAAALEASTSLLLEIGQPAVWNRIEMLTDSLVEGLASLGFGIASPRRPDEKSAIVSFTVPGFDPDAVARLLRERRIHIAARGGRLRCAPHFYNSPGQIAEVIETLAAVKAGRITG